jgi:shikimate kinase
VRDQAPPGGGIALIGYRGTGKTTVGRLVAEGLGRPFVDCDAEVEARAGWTIGAIFASEGEAAFRDREEAAIREVCRESPGAVLATGGGAILRETNREALAAFGTVVWLSAPADVLVERLRKDAESRPALTAAGLLDEVAVVLEAREPLYRATADLIVDASAPDPRLVAEEVVRRYRESSGKGGAR